MATLPWPAGQDVLDLFTVVKEKHHHDRLFQAKIAVCFSETKPFIKGRFNWGKVMKFSPLMKLWHPTHSKYDFMVILCADAWHSILNSYQKEALVDLHLTRCSVDYIPAMAVDEYGKNKVVKDEWGRIQYTNEIKFDDENNPKWKVLPLDILVFTENVLRYGPWSEDIHMFKEALDQVPVPTAEEDDDAPEPQHTAQLLTEAQIQLQNSEFGIN
jgi:hypothetical protein